MCCFFAGLIGRSLPHLKNLGPKELSGRPDREIRDGKISADDSLGLHWAIVRIAAVLSFAGFVIALHAGWRWFWAIALAAGVFIIYPLFIAAFYILPSALRAKR